MCQWGVHKEDGKIIICCVHRAYRHMDSPADVHQVNRRCGGAGLDEFGEGRSNAHAGSVTLPTHQSAWPRGSRDIRDRDG